MDRAVALTDVADRGSYYEVDIANLPVARCCVDHAFTLEFGRWTIEARLRIETAFTVMFRGAWLRLDPADDRTRLGPALALFEKVAQTLNIHKDGSLHMSFADGTVLEVSSDARYEAWSFHRGDVRLVARPGGGIAWGERGFLLTW